MKAVITSTTVSNRSGMSQKGKPYSINTQEAMIHLDNGEVRKLELNIEDNKPPYPVGEYTVDVSNILTIGRYGFELKRFEQPVLIPIKPMPFSKVS